jgi:iron complex outermembrane receptor protein
LLEPTGIQQTIRGNFQVWSYRQADVLLAGVDYNLRYEFNPAFIFDQQFSLVKGYESIQGGQPLINMPPPQIIHGITYKIDRLQNLEIRLESAFTGRQNEFPDTNFQAFIPEMQTLELIDVSTPPKAYHLINLELRYPLLKLGHGLSQFSIRVENLRNTAYRNYLNSNRFYADEIGRNFLLSFATTF